MKQHLPPLPWIRLGETIKPAQGQIRVVIDERPQAGRKVIAELYFSDSDKPVQDPFQLLSPTYKLSEREKACVQLFTQAEPFSLRKDRFVLTPRQLESLFLMQQAFAVEVRGVGSIAVEPEPAHISARLETIENNEIAVRFGALDHSGRTITAESIFGVHQALLLDANLRLYHLDPALLPEEAQSLLDSPPLPLFGLLHGDSKPVFEALLQMGIDLSGLSKVAEEPSPKSEITLRAFLQSSSKSSAPTLRAHLVTTLNYNALAEEVEIPAKGLLAPVHPLTDTDRKLSHEALPGAIVKRNHHEEEEARLSLFRLGLVASSNHRGFMAEGQAALDILAKIGRGDSLPQHVHVDTELLPSLEHLQDQPQLMIQQEMESGHEVFSLGMDLPKFSTNFNFEDLLLVAQKGGRALLLDDDRVLTFSQKAAEALAWLSDTLDIKNSESKRKLSFIEMAFFIRASKDFFQFAAKDDIKKRLLNFIPELLPDDHRLPDSLQTTLRPYQKEAVTWLSQLHRAGLGRLLADDMGLGKTLMVLCLIAKLKEKHGQKTSLIVAPTSVIDVWVDEAHRHFSNLKAVKWHGPDRINDIESLSSADLVVTSYALLRRDAENVLSKHEFRYLVLDEAQNVKNPRTESWKAAASMNSEQRLALTGTPIENRILDLYSILSLVAPSVLGSEKTFLKRYAGPIQNGNIERARELRERVRPIVLRRQKSDVERDLPPKIENVMRCEMTAEQRSLYRQILISARDELSAQLASPLSNKSRMPFLAAITRLRQVCCDPRLVKTENFPSAKLALFEEALVECLSMGRRMIIYSQFIKMQEILLQVLRKNGVEDALWLHGGSKNRDQIVQKFQDPNGPKAIVVSLKAGGTGITLTAADTVIYYDLWWNPAVLDQAADRAHRIGQTKAVHLIKLVCADTIEEQILALSEKKRAIAQSMLVADTAGQRMLSMEEIYKLLNVELEREQLT